MQQGMFSQAFKVASRAAGFLAKAGAVYGALAVTPHSAQAANVNWTAGSLALPAYRPLLRNNWVARQQMPSADRPITMDGFQVEQASMVEWPDVQRTDAIYFYRLYQDDRTQLDSEIARCDQNAPDCRPLVRLLRDTAKQISLLADPQEQVEAVQSFVNTLIREDTEDSVLQIHHYTMVEALGWQSGSCRQRGFLKYTMLDLIDFPDPSVKLVFELPTINGNVLRPGHVVAEVALGGKTWVMDDPLPPKNGQTLQPTDIWAAITQNSALLSDRNQTNRTVPNPAINSSVVKLYPWVWVGRNTFGIYRKVAETIHTVPERSAFAPQAPIETTDLQQDIQYPNDRESFIALLRPAIDTRNYLQHVHPMELSQR